MGETAGRLPTGTVTFLFTDIEGSTQRWERDREAMEAAVRLHDEILRGAIESHGGHIFKTIGDAFCAVFARPEDAVVATLDAQRRLAVADFSAVDGVRVRMALHTGTTDERDGDYFGPTVNRVARLLSAGHGGQVLLSGITADLVRELLPAGTSLLDLGRHRLKDLAEPMVVAQIIAPELDKAFPVLRSLEARTVHLPQLVTSFIGRENDLAEALRLFEQTRLLTLSGTGGVGKTRMAVQLAANVSERFTDGVWFVDLAPVTDGMFVSPTLLTTVGLREEAGRDTSETLVNHLREKKVLLVVDNCEHVIAAAAPLENRLLRDCPRVQFISTSREVLDIPGEVVYRVGTLAVDESAALFASRAQAVAPAFAITPENAQTIRKICTRLDGIPLAIELAAARVKMMSVDDLWKRLDDRFRILTGGSRTALPRQQTLRGLIEWSYNLLDEPEKVLLRRLATFAGTFSLDLATNVCAFDPLEDFEVLDLLSHLIDKSLVQVEPGNERYWLLESTREFALECLGQADETVAMQRRRLAFLTSVGEQAHANIKTPRFNEFLAAITRDYAEYRAALTWAILEQHDVTLGAQLALALPQYWYDSGQSREGRFWMERLLEHEGKLELELRARLYHALNLMYFELGDYDLMEPMARRADEAYGRLGLIESQLGAKTGVALAAYFSGRYDQAHEQFETIIRMARDNGVANHEVIAMCNLAEMLTDWKSDYEGSERLYEQALALAHERGFSNVIGTMLGDWSQTAAYAGAFERANSLVSKSLESFRQLGNEQRVAEQLIRQGHYRVWSEDYEGARAALREAVAILEQARHPREFVRLIEACAQLAAKLDVPERAVTLLGFSDRWRKSKSLSRSTPMNERLNAALATAKEKLGDDAFSVAWERGRTLAPEMAFAEAETILTGGIR